MHSESLLVVAVGLPLRFGASLTENVLIVMLGVGTVFSILISLLSFAAFVKRRTVSYLLIAVAFSTFLGKTSLGLAYLLGSTNTEMHHLLEHTLDVVMMVWEQLDTAISRQGSS
jgi:hypothetical protein